MLSLTNGKKHIYLLLLGVFVTFSMPSAFAQVFENDEETASWVIDLWEPINSNPTSKNTTTVTTGTDQITEWDIGSALGIATESVTEKEEVSGGSSGSGDGGRLGTANYSFRNRSALVSLERQNTIVQENNDLEFDPTYIVTEELPRQETTLQNTIVKDESHDELEIIDHMLIAEAGRDDLVTPYEEPVVKERMKYSQQQTNKPQVIKSSAPLKTTLINRNLSSQNRNILLKANSFPVQKTHLMSWEGMQEDIASYKQDVIKKVILNILVITGKALFYTSNVGILLFLLFREKLTLFHRNKVRQLTLFSLLK